MSGSTIMDDTRTKGFAAHSDPDLVLRARKGEPGAFRELYRRHREPVLSFLARLTGDPPAAEDLLQETFLRVHQHLDRYDAQQAFPPWLFRIARNLALNALASQKKPGRDTAEEAVQGAAGSDRVPRLAAAQESERAARAALDALSPETRALLLQRHGLGMKLEELASSWDVNERTIRTRLQAAVDQLTRALLAQRAGGVA